MTARKSATRKKAVPKAKVDIGDTKPQTDKPKEKIQDVKGLTRIYEDALEIQIKQLYNKFVAFISVSQIPLVHVNIVLDLVKKELLEQVQDGYFGKKKETE